LTFVQPGSGDRVTEEEKCKIKIEIQIAQTSNLGGEGRNFNGRSPTIGRKKGYGHLN